MEKRIIISNSSNVIINDTGNNVAINDTYTINRLISVIEQQNEQINRLLQIICMQRMSQADSGARQLTNDLPEM